MLRLGLYCLLMVGCVFQGVAGQMGKIVYGYVEKARLVDNNLVLSAKLDTGAKSASLSAIHIKEINKNGKTYLSFDIPTKTGLVPFQAEFVGKVKIKARVDENKAHIIHHAFIHRPMVLIKLQLGSNIQTISVNLTNRKRFIYPLLLGRSAIIAFNGLVDPSSAFLLKKKTDEKQ